MARVVSLGIWLHELLSICLGGEDLLMLHSGSCTSAGGVGYRGKITEADISVGSIVCGIETRLEGVSADEEAAE